MGGRWVAFEMGSSGGFGEHAPGTWKSAAVMAQRLHRMQKREQWLAPESRWGRWAWIYNGVSRLPQQRSALRQWRAALTTNSWYDLHAALPEAGAAN